MTCSVSTDAGFPASLEWLGAHVNLETGIVLGDRNGGGFILTRSS